MSLDLSRRPTYVLGAGFSKAVSKAMPLTDELGEELAQRLSGQIDITRRADETFEAWLTLQSTPLPFLHGFENSRRAADAARVIDEIAHVLDERLASASQDPAPLWLRQLVAIWHTEKAVVLTFNYDTLVERTINVTAPTTISAQGHVSHVMGDHVVFPSPPAPQAQFLGDAGTGHSNESFELLKMHGSLNWHWASGDPTGSTLVRTREKYVFGASEPLATETDFSGATTLDRYLIPPITTKDGYYGSYLANSLWRMARSHISSAESLTLIGYSLPLEDRVTGQLIAQVPSDAPVAVVDWDPGEQSPPRSVLGNLSKLGVSATAAASGPESVEAFVADKLRSTIEALPQSPAFMQLNRATADVVVAISKGWGGTGLEGLFVLAWNDAEQTFQAHEVEYRYLHGSEMPYRESVLNSMPQGHRKLEDFVTASRLHELINDHSPFTFQSPHSDEKLVAIGAERRQIERWEVLEVKWAPYS